MKRMERLKKRILPILKKHKVVRAGIFGSYVRGEQKKNSDVDIIIQAPKDMGIEFVRLNYDLEGALKKKVDLITYNGANIRIKKYILDDEIRII